MGRRSVLAVVVGAQVLAVASTTSVAVVLPALSRDLGASATEQQWVVDAFVLVLASLLIAGGAAADRYGRRRCFIVGLSIFAAGSLWCAIAPSVSWLLAGRVIQGLGPPLVLPASLAIITHSFTEPVVRARAVGVWGAGSGAGLATGPLLGGLVVEAFGWRETFAVNIPICLLLLTLALAAVPRDRPTRDSRPFDVVGAVYLTGSVAALVFALIEGNGLGWDSAPVLATFAGSGFAGFAFLHRERRHPSPIVDLALLSRRAFAGANLAALAFYGALTGSAIYISIFLQEVQGRSALEAGFFLLPQGALTMLCAPLAGYLTPRIGPRPTIVAGMACGVAGFAGLTGLDASTPPWLIWSWFALLGIGAGIALPAMTVVALSAAPARRSGMAAAIHNASRQLGQTFSVAILGAIIVGASGVNAGFGDPWMTGLHRAMFFAAAGLVIAAAVVAVLIPARAAD